MRVLPEILNIDTHTGALHESQILEMSLFVLVMVLFVLKMWTQYCEINVMLGSGQMLLSPPVNSIYQYPQTLLEGPDITTHTTQSCCVRALAAGGGPKLFTLHNICPRNVNTFLLKWQTLVRWKAAENIERGRASVLLGIDRYLLATGVNDSEPLGAKREGMDWRSVVMFVLIFSQESFSIVELPESHPNPRLPGLFIYPRLFSSCVWRGIRTTMSVHPPYRWRVCIPEGTLHPQNFMTHICAWMCRRCCQNC